MGFIKIALIIGGVVIGAGAISGIAAVVVASRQAEFETPGDPTTPPEKPVAKPMNPSSGNTNNEQGDDGSVVTTNDLDTVLGLATKENIVIVENQNSKEKNNKADYYAFNLKNTNLKLKEKTKIPEGFSVELTINTKGNTVETLNKGSLSVLVTAKKAEGEETKTKTVDLEGFKPGDTELEKLLEADKTTLKLIPKEAQAENFVSIEDLNKQGSSQSPSTKYGLTEWLEKSGKDQGMIKDVSLSGEVKLVEIKKEEDKTYFILESKKGNEFLKLTKTDGKEILVKQIKTTNVLASDVTLIPKSINESETKKFLTELEKPERKFDKTNQNSTLGRHLSVMVPKDASTSDPKSQVFIKPLVTTTTYKMDNEDLTIPLVLKITFGNDESAKEYDTDKEADVMALVNAGLSFYIYARVQTKGTMDINVDDLSNNHAKLETYLKDENYKKPSAKPDTSDGSPILEIKNDNFTVAGLINKDFDKGFNLKIKAVDMPKNYVLFSSYSYKTATNKDQLMNKVLFTPSVSLLHIQATKEEANM